MGDDSIKKNATKAFGIVIGVGVVVGIALLATYVVNYGLSYSQNSALVGK